MRCSTIAVLVGFTMFVDMIVYGIVVPVLPTVAQDKLHMDEAELGFLFGSYALGLILSTLPTAYLSDRYRNRKWPMIIGLAGLGASTLIFAHAETYWALLAARITQGFAGGAPWTVGLSLLADVYPAEQLGVSWARIVVLPRGSTSYAAVYGIFNLAYSAAILFGPTVAGVLLAQFGFAIEMAAFGGSLIVLLLFLAWTGLGSF
ncbi:hypothetical protein AMAG_12666 [Allomyces macrogynus ATCC 38327]|uniref:Major facilitator superfamily (MFS) profile domain-containing protein n=1 Tax=Allomyces macrogynus (strain ATCC 38327) TaxID=578462 RepID=A0A0L0T1J2_ALLM3|nr:hypothetical protein AMAG_12666 [Allomyces macrogynus ATCC 38327]|eukprot:KNE68490.1 hypothetical protein AMAG_12666 [Allomyces macrogynus ATCC 38327]